MQQYWEPKRPRKRSSKEEPEQCEAEEEEAPGADQEEGEEEELEEDPVEGEDGDEVREEEIKEEEIKEEEKKEDGVGNEKHQEASQHHEASSPMITDEMLMQSFGLFAKTPEPPRAFFSSPAAPVLDPAPQRSLLCDAPPPEMTEERLAFIETLGLTG